MLYEVITLEDFPKLGFTGQDVVHPAHGLDCLTHDCEAFFLVYVITSYSIHYTKLYEAFGAVEPAARELHALPLVTHEDAVLGMAEGGAVGQLGLVDAVVIGGIGGNSYNFV